MRRSPLNELRFFYFSLSEVALLCVFNFGQTFKFCMLRILILLGFFTVTIGYAQDSAQYVRRYTSVWRSVNIGYKISNLKSNDFQSNFTDLYQTGFGSQLTSVVLELSGPDNYLEEAYLAIGYYLPIAFTSGDTSTWQVQGFCIDMPIIKSLNLLYALKEFDLPVSANWQIGSLYQKHNNSKSHNFFLNFGLRINPRVLVLKRVTLGMVADISWDITRPDWKYNGNVVPGSFDFKNSSYGLQFNIGWRYTRWQGSWMRIYNDL